MDAQKALEVVAKLHQEKDLYHKKSVKAKRGFLISVIIGGLFLIGFIVTIIISNQDYSFKSGLVLTILFGVAAFVFLELAIILFALNKCVYVRQEENRKKILAYIEKEVNQHKTNKY